MAFILTETVKPDLLQQAVIDCRDRFPSFYVRLRQGIFWYYYESNDKMPIVKPESSFIGDKIDGNNGYGFTFFYYQNRVSLEVFHSLCDGTGALIFLKAVVYRYLELSGIKLENDGSIFTVDQHVDILEVEDSYVKNYNTKQYPKIKVPKSFKNKLKRYRYGSGVIIGKVKTDDIHRLAKHHDLTITQYIVALLTYSIMLINHPNKLNLPINICIPVNMRRFYDSITVRNFSLYLHTSIMFHETLDFEAILPQIKTQFKENLTPEKMQARLNSNVAIEKNPLVRISPLVLKKIMMRIGYHLLGNLPTTATLSNVGLVTLPNSMQPYVQNVEFNLVAETVSGISVVSYLEQTNISFSRISKTTNLEQTFFTLLTGQGIDVEIQTNKWETKGE